jgi:hypothetical protein
MKTFKSEKDFLASNERVGFLHVPHDCEKYKITILTKTQAELDEAIKTCDRLKKENTTMKSPSDLILRAARRGESNKPFALELRYNGPFHRSREIDLSYDAAKAISLTNSGVSKVEIKY